MQLSAKGDNNPAETGQTNGAPTLDPMHSRKILTHITRKEILTALKNLKNRKAAGADGIPNETFKIAARAITLILQTLYNTMLSAYNDPIAWNVGLLHLIFKGKGDINDLTNYRGITVNNCISKIFTTILNTRLSPMIEEAGILGNI